MAGKCGRIRKVPGSGYSNLETHVSRQHSSEFHSFFDDAVSSAASASNSASSFVPTIFYKQKTVHIHRWMSFIVDALQPFSLCANDAA